MQFNNPEFGNERCFCTNLYTVCAGFDVVGEEKQVVVFFVGL